MALFRNKVPVSIIGEDKMRSYQNRVDPQSKISGVLMKRTQALALGE